jgi:hypothetical protein
MTCPRCRGLMIGDLFEDIKDDTGRNGFLGWRCVLCGEILDPVIVTNRTVRPTPMVSATRRRYTATHLGG